MINEKKIMMLLQRQFAHIYLDQKNLMIFHLKIIKLLQRQFAYIYLESIAKQNYDVVLDIKFQQNQTQSQT